MTAQDVAVGVVVVAVLVVRTAVAERREPGSGVAQWRFLRDAKALAAGLIVFVGITIGALVSDVRPGAVLWALLAGLLVALITYQLTHQRPRS
ncbi:hypothetical protein [Streptomyces sp. AK010]|uniref:hypothetical protein n=1 Tax=Streptomyces sp. AK010 TaxID=2723074 RepID=UPI001609B89E|nr:hypothetical protein [Streptomyces sp. AK010]MBB6415788.1 putative membrane protein [Streptomyces sp. AK010]